MISVSHLSKTFESKSATVTALSDVSFEVEKGEIFGIIGLSGAGKSTLVRCLNLLEKPDEGKIEGLDPKKTSFVLDTYWVQHGGADIRYMMEKLAGRIDLIHLKDMGKTREPDEQFITEIGNGNLWWEGIIHTAEKIGVKYYVVEQDVYPGDPFDSIKISSDYLHEHFMK